MPVIYTVSEWTSTSLAILNNNTHHNNSEENAPTELPLAPSPWASNDRAPVTIPLLAHIATNKGLLSAYQSQLHPSYSLYMPRLERNTP